MTAPDQNTKPAAIKAVAARPRRANADRRHLTLWLAVGGIMAVIVTVWVMFLPYQISRERLRGAMRSDRWQPSGEPAANGVSVFNAQMNALEAKLEAQTQALSASAANGTKTPAVAPPDTATMTDAALRDSLEAKLRTADNAPVTPPITTATPTPKP